MTVGRTPLLPLGILCAVVVGITYAMLRGGAAGSPELQARTPSTSKEATTQEAEESAIGPVDSPDQVAGERTQVPAQVIASEADAGTKCVVLGRVIDEHDDPVPGAIVRLQAYKVWAEGVEIPRLEGPYEYRGFEVQTDSDGAFRITAPVPTTKSTWLTIEPGPYHDSHRVTFETLRERALPSLTAGERDLGVLRLAGTGAIRGRVTDVTGLPVGGAKMDTGPGRVMTYSRGGTTAEDGTYSIPHARVGTYWVKVKVEGYLSASRDSITVETGRDTVGVDFVMTPAPTIGGTVRDAAGRPVEGATVGGWPVITDGGGGQGAWTKSDAEGRFVLALPQENRYTLQAKRDGYLPWGDEHDRSVTYEPGTRDVEATLAHLPEMEFLVLDDATEDPVPLYGLAIITLSLHSRRYPPQQKEWPTGIAPCGARSGVDEFLIVAEGYLSVAGQVEHGPGDPPRQVVRLRRGATLVGRVLRDGAPLASAPVEVEFGGMVGQRGPDAAPPTFFVDTGRGGSATTGSDGRFELAGLHGGTCRITIHPRSGAPLVVFPVEVARDGTTDAGDLIVLEGGSIAGRVLVPAGIQPGGLAVWLDDPRDRVSVTVDGDGAFRFDDLSPGTHALTLDGRPAELAPSDAVQVEVTQGETASVTLDGLDRGMIPVTLSVYLGGRPAAGARIDLLPDGDSRERATLGMCDEAGRVRGHARAWGAARVVAWFSNRRVVHPDALLKLEPNTEIDEVVRFEFASVTLVLPEGVHPPASCLAKLSLESPGGEAVQGATLRIKDGVANGASPDAARFEQGALWFGYLFTGPHQLRIELTDTDAEPVLTPLGGGKYTMSRPIIWEASIPVDLRAGEDLRVVLE